MSRSVKVTAGPLRYEQNISVGPYTLRPKSGSGKILKRVLRDRFWKQQERAEVG